MLCASKLSYDLNMLALWTLWVHTKHLFWDLKIVPTHYSDIIMNAVAAQFTGASVVCSTVSSGTDQNKHQSSASLAFVMGIRQSPGGSLSQRPVARKMFPFDDVLMIGELSRFVGTSLTNHPLPPMAFDVKALPLLLP